MSIKDKIYKVQSKDKTSSLFPSVKVLGLFLKGSVCISVFKVPASVILTEFENGLVAK